MNAGGVIQKSGAKTNPRTLIWEVTPSTGIRPASANLTLPSRQKSDSRTFRPDVVHNPFIHSLIPDYLTTVQHLHITASHVYPSSLKPDCNETSRASDISSCSTPFMLYSRKRIETTRKVSHHHWRNYIYCLRSLFVLAAAESITE